MAETKWYRCSRIVIQFYSVTEAYRLLYVMHVGIAGVYTPENRHACFVTVTKWTCMFTLYAKLDVITKGWNGKMFEFVCRV